MNYFQNKEPWYASIVVIVIAMFVFWPVGCALLFLRWMKKSGKYKAINNVLLACASFLLFMGVVGILVTFTEWELSNFLIFLFIFLIPGIICGFFWFIRNDKIKGYDLYLAYINVRNKIKIDALCNKLNVDYETATNALTDMINKGMLDGYLEEDELILRTVNTKFPTNIPLNMLTDKPAVKKETKIVKCKECGAKNTVVVGEKSECEYCGTLLQ